MFNDIYTKNLCPTIVLVGSVELVVVDIKTVLLIVDKNYTEFC